jgi:hypothetical protein
MQPGYTSHKIACEEHVIVDGIQMSGTRKLRPRKAGQRVEGETIDDSEGLEKDEEHDERDDPTVKHERQERHAWALGACTLGKK